MRNNLQMLASMLAIHAREQVGEAARTSVEAMIRQTATLAVGDDGIGYVRAIEGSRRGLGLCKRLLERVGARLEHSAARGTLWTISVPIDP